MTSASVTTPAINVLALNHLQMLRDGSGLTDEVIAARGWQHSTKRRNPLKLATITRGPMIRRYAMTRTDTRRILGGMINLARRRHAAQYWRGCWGCCAGGSHADDITPT